MASYFYISIKKNPKINIFLSLAMRSMSQIILALFNKLVFSESLDACGIAD